MKALIVDPAVHSMGGHHFNAVQRLQREFAALGVPAPCLGSAYANRRVIDELACTPTFTKSVYGRSYIAPGEFAANVEETRRQLSQAMRRVGRPDLIVLPCCDQVLAAALASELARPRLAAAPAVLLWVLYAPHHLKAPDDPQAFRFQAESRAAFTELAACSGGLRLHCETPAMADFYRRLLGLEVGVLAGPGLVARPRATAAAATRPTVSCIGFANRAKGYGLLPEAVALVLQRHADARFMIHGVVEGSDAEADRTTFERLARLGDRVVTRQGVLESDEYLDRLAEADLLLLPYDPAVYRSRGSGVFSDARAIGIPVVAPRDCAFAAPAFDQGWGIKINEYNDQATGLAVLEALDRLADLRIRAAAAARQAGDGLGDVLRSAVAGGRPGRGRLTGILGRFRPGSA
jgi:glycosyltransferase involved in cell wall biosynthesis